VNKGKKFALLLDVSAELLKRGSWCGETHIQKASFLLQQLLGVETDFDFILYKHGPFSFDLRDALTEMIADGLVEEVVRRSDYGPSLVATGESERFLERFPKTLAKYSPQIQFIANWIRDKNVGELERLTTAAFVIQNREDLDAEEMAREIVRAKPHIVMHEAKAALAEAQRLIKTARQYQYRESL
jgi:uncharacterized protein YwgA